ncbi:MAG: DUF58 domain-containing protein [Planctomycetes bacterium]|nr:DUF58 domain-containing protein [Planctomycetota bacterium]
MALLDEDFLAKIERLRLVVRRRAAGGVRGERRSRRRGLGSEFSDYRNYVLGDDPRAIDWNIYARLERLFIKLFLEEEDLRVHILIDRSASMRFGDPDKFEYARRLAAALGYVALLGGDCVAVASLGEDAREIVPPSRGRACLWRLLGALERIEPDGGTDLAAGARAYAYARAGRGLAILISDLLDPGGFEGALRALLAGRREVFVFHILSPQEIDPPLAGDLRLIDAEGSGEVDVTISAPLLARYRRTLAGFRRSVRRFALARGITEVFASTSVPFDRLILESLRRLGVLA